MADLGEDQQLIKFLEKHGLDPGKWLKIFHQENVAISKPDQIIAIKGSDEHYQILSSNATTKEQQVLRKILGISLATHNPDAEIENKLEEARLKSKFWLPIFKNELGVTSPQALMNVGEESFSMLQQFVQKAWEKKALRKLLGMEDEETSFQTQRERHRKKLQKRLDESKQLLQDLEGLQKEGNERHDQAVEQVENGIREALQIPPNVWIPSDTKLKPTIHSLQSNIKELNEILQSREDSSGIQVLQNASGGLALQGFLLSRNLDDQMQSRDKLLNPPGDIQLVGPSLSRVEKLEVFCSQHQEDRFRIMMDKLGYSASASAKAGFWGGGAQVGGGYSKSTESETTSEKELYCSTIKYSFVPLASSCFKDSQLLLSDNALKKLKAIETLIVSKPQDSAVQDECQMFFNQFGSHANKGHLHFGGIYWRKCVSIGFEKKKLETVKRLQREVVDMKASVSYGCLVGASAEANRSKVEASFKEKDLISKTTLEVTADGGPPKITSLPQWKTGLAAASNSTWNLIDRGTSTVPIWEIVQMNHRRDFRNSEELAKTLHQAWQQMTKIHTESSITEQPNQEAEAAVRKMQHIMKWSETTEKTEHLSELLSIKQSLVRDGMNLQAWLDLYLSQPPLKQYLRSVMTANQGVSGRHIEYTKDLMSQLVKPPDVCLLKDLADISEWLYHTDKAEALVALKRTDIANLRMIIESNLKEMRLAKAKSSSLYEELREEQDVKIRATAIITKAVNYLRKGFKEAKQKYEELFLVTLLLPCQYDVMDRIFRQLFSTSDLEYLKKEVEVRSKEFGGDSRMKLQAYLFQLAVKMYDRNDVYVTEAQIKSHLGYLQKEIKGDIDPNVRHVLIQFNSNKCDWIGLRHQLESLAKGIPLECKDIGKELLALLSEPQHPESTRSSESHDVSSGNVHELFEKLGLLKYMYNPEKLTLQNALLLRQETLNEQCPKLELLPYFILQKLMMHDFKCRGVLFQSSSIAPVEPSKKRDDFDDFDDLDVSPPNVGVHPMDGLLALLHSSDNFLRQDLISRLSTCQLAIPFLLPDPITHTLSLSLWAMRTTVKEWKCKDPETGKSKSGGSPIVSYPTPIVSFCRLTDNRSELSKSRILNEVISDSPHNYFFHFHCDGGSTKSLLMDGLVELCWYLPSGKPEDPFAQVITFTNLRGKALSHPKQTKFLSQVSFMNFILLTEDNLNKEGIQILKDLAEDTPGGIVLLFLDKKFTPQHEGMKELMASIPRDKCYRMKLSGKSAADIKRSIREEINSKLAYSQKGFKTIEDCATVARANGINVDEDDPDCVLGRKLASDIQEALDKLPTGDKDVVLPLQSRKLWHEWAKHDKERHRHIHIGAKGIDRYNTEQDDEKTMIREQQVFIAESLSSVMKCFLSNLLKYKGHVRNYYLQWLKFVLDNYSRKKLPELFSQYQEVRMQLLKLQREHKTGEEEAKGLLKEKLEELNETLVHASFGLEHLLREVGQIFEAVVQQKRKLPQLIKQVNRLPQMAAELLASGYPLELMDGDASHVPLHWVMAVLEKLSELLKNAHLFVLSVLGIQSTGKSTLLNTMFGLRFTVSAGRCTRGAFMQLLRFNKTLKKQTKCDYLLIIDTEGLRAPELSSQDTQKHDNELATFVIGLANVTLINIFGETPGDMDDILQRAVHAFIRMEKVGLKPSCQFVHQNVGAVSSASRGMMGRVNFQEKLNTMTRAAAAEEKLEGSYTMFSHVIDFNEEKDVWYFPGLWKGDPPMAPVNPGYSDGALQLKSGLIEKTNVGAHCLLSGFQTRVHDLWEAILHENFIFSFKNTLEITAYNQLDAKYAQWSWEFQRGILEWQDGAKNRIRSTDIGKPLNDLKVSLVNELSATGTKIHADLTIQVKEFFEHSEQREVLAQWQRRTDLRLDDVRKEQEADAKHQIIVLISARQALAEADSMKQGHRDELLLFVKKLVSKLERGKLNDTQLEQLYEKKWREWMENMKSKQCIDQEKPDVGGSLENCLRDLLSSYHNLLNPKLPLKTRMKGSLIFTINTETHITANRLWENVWGTLQPAHTEAAQRETKQFLQDASNYLKGKKEQNFNPAFSHELLKNLLGAIAAAHAEYKEFNFTSMYKVDLALTVCEYAKVHFTQMAEDFRKMNDPVEYLQRKMKEPFRRLFKSQYNQTAQEVAAAHNLCDLLVKQIEEALKSSLAQQIAIDVKSSSGSFATKRALKARILCDLADKQTFDDYAKYMTYEYPAKMQSFDYYADYLDDVERSVQAWVEFYIMKHCHEQPRAGKTRFTKLAESELERLVATISTAANKVTCRTVRNWLFEFHSKLVKELPEKIQQVDGDLKQLAGHRVVREVTGQLAQLDVAKIESFGDYVKAVEALVEKYTEQHSEQSQGETRLTEEELGRLVAFISTAANEVTSSFPKALIEEWLLLFHSELMTKLSLDLREMQEVVGDLKDPKNFTEELCKKLAALNVQEFKSLYHMDEWETKPHDIVVKALIGCCEQCPFCKEQCEFTNPKHSEKHFSLHRPQCLGGWSWVSSDKMILETCNALVASKSNFRYQDKEGKTQWKPYSKYQEIHKSWSISPDSSLQQASYWKWFVATYTADIADHFGMQQNEISEAWRTLTLDTVKKDLEKLYNL